MSQTPYKSEEEARFVALEEESAEVQASQIAANASAIAVLEGGVGHPADLHAFHLGTLVAGSAFHLWQVSRSTSIPTQSAVGTAVARVASDGSNIDISLKHEGVTIGTVKFVGTSASGLVDVSSAVVMVPGDILLASNLNVDTAAQDVAFVIKANTV
jgi:hypothetical protein